MEDLKIIPLINIHLHSLKKYSAQPGRPWWRACGICRVMGNAETRRAKRFGMADVHLNHQRHLCVSYRYGDESIVVVKRGHSYSVLSVHISASFSGEFYEQRSVMELSLVWHFELQACHHYFSKLRGKWMSNRIKCKTLRNQVKSCCTVVVQSWVACYSQS